MPKISFDVAKTLGLMVNLPKKKKHNKKSRKHKKK